MLNNLKALFGFRALSSMDHDDITDEIAALTFTDRRLVEAAITVNSEIDQDEATRIAGDVRNINRRRLLAYAFSGVCAAGAATIRLDTELSGTQETLQDALRREELRDQLHGEEIERVDYNREIRELDAKRIERQYSLQNYIPNILSGGVSAAAAAYAYFWGTRRELKREDMKLLADLNRSSDQTNAITHLTDTIQKATP